MRAKPLWAVLDVRERSNAITLDSFRAQIRHVCGSRAGSSELFPHPVEEDDQPVDLDLELSQTPVFKLQS